jgi:hypothetical protein
MAIADSVRLNSATPAQWSFLGVSSRSVTGTRKEIGHIPTRQLGGMLFISNRASKLVGWLQNLLCVLSVEVRGQSSWIRAVLRAPKVFPYHRPGYPRGCCLGHCQDRVEMVKVDATFRAVFKTTETVIVAVVLGQHAT